MTNLIFREMSLEQKQIYAKALFFPIDSALNLKDWIRTFLGLDMPIGHVDLDSNSSPVEAMWEIYKTIKENKGEENPGYIMLSAREGYKTLSSAILETILMLHFQVTIAHMAAIKEQSAKSISYINYFFSKIAPLLEVAGWENKSQNKTKVEWKSPQGEDVYIQVIVATMSGANSAHTNLMFIDEIDVVKDPQAYEEAKLIPGFSKGIHPVTVKLSTRKFAFGLMQKEIDNVRESGDKILRWNLIDVTAKCQPERHKPEEAKVIRYVQKALPLKQISEYDFNELPEVEKDKWDRVNAFSGCQNCRLLPVCRTRLATRPESDVNGLWKPVGAVINTFKKTNPDMGEAQLMCWKPSAKGMVYPRFDSNVDIGNVLSLEKAFETLIGDKPKKSKLTEIDLLLVMKQLGIEFFAGVDWGYTHDFVIVVFAKIPNGQIWIVDCYSMSGLEFPDVLSTAITYRDKYGIIRWFADQAYPSNIKSFRKNSMPCPKFTKDVMGGIEALRAKIVDGVGNRFLQVLNTDANQKLILAFLKHHFTLDMAGNPTTTPDDTPGVADQADAMRYVAQNLFPLKGPQKPIHSQTDVAIQQDMAAIDQSTPEGRAKYQDMMKQAEKSSEHVNQMKAEIQKLVGDGPVSINTGKKGGFFYSS